MSFSYLYFLEKTILKNLNTKLQYYISILYFYCLNNCFLVNVIMQILIKQNIIWAIPTNKKNLITSIYKKAKISLREKIDTISIIIPIFLRFV